ncbi:MAG: single-stranded-DNA-specific exonuclease RecJ [Selenomonadaceae bacterium]
MQKKWNFIDSDKRKTKQAAALWHVSEIIASVLLHRGIEREKEASVFLYPEKQPFYDAFLIKDMDKAVSRIKIAIDCREKIMIYGDYDVDGTTATVVLVRALRALGANVEYYIPNRQKEGYGFNIEALTMLADKTNLLISVDCGISAIKEVKEIKEKLDIIITDHHLPGEVLPEAVAVLDPQRRDCLYPDKNLAGVGVAFKLCQALWRKIKNQVFEDDLALVALGTIADIVPLLGENRRIVRFGLEEMNKTKNRGLKTLIGICKLNDKKINAGHVGFVLAPRFNAAGRLDSALIGADLLLTDEQECADALALQLNQENEARQLLEKDILEKAETLLEVTDTKKRKIIVIVGENWHAGVIGIVASRIVEKYYRPVIIISIQDGFGKASCRSIKGFHMYKALDVCKEYLLGFGGHAQAAGFSILSDKIKGFSDAISAYADNVLQLEDLIPILDIEAKIKPEEVCIDLVKDLERLEPFGMGNPRPIFACCGTKITGARSMGRDGIHLGFDFFRGGIRAIAWNHGKHAKRIDQKIANIAFQPEINVWQGNSQIQCKVQELQLVEENQPIGKETCISHDIIGRVYLILKSKKDAADAVHTSFAEVAASYKKQHQSYLPVSVVAICVTILAELNLVQCEKKSKGTVQLYFQPAPKTKLNLLQSTTYANIMKENDGE